MWYYWKFSSYKRKILLYPVLETTWSWCKFCYQIWGQILKEVFITTKRSIVVYVTLFQLFDILFCHLNMQFYFWVLCGTLFPSQLIPEYEIGFLPNSSLQISSSINNFSTRLWSVPEIKQTVTFIHTKWTCWQVEVLLVCTFNRYLHISYLFTRFKPSQVWSRVSHFLKVLDKSFKTPLHWTDN